MLTVADAGEGCVKNPQKSADVINGRPLCIIVCYWPTSLKGCVLIMQGKLDDR